MQNPTMPFKDEEIMTVSEVAKHMKVSKDVIYQMCKEKELPCIKFRKQIRILGWQLREWLELEAKNKKLAK